LREGKIHEVSRIPHPINTDSNIRILHAFYLVVFITAAIILLQVIFVYSSQFILNKISSPDAIPQIESSRGQEQRLIIPRNEYILLFILVFFVGLGYRFYKELLSILVVSLIVVILQALIDDLTLTYTIFSILYPYSLLIAFLVIGVGFRLSGKIIEWYHASILNDEKYIR